MPPANASTDADGARDARPAHGGRLDALDGLRAVAVTLVVLFHVHAPGFASGFAGVDVFFVLSGYLITTGLVRSLQRGRGAGLSSFWVRRFKRLVPAAALVLVVVLGWSVLVAAPYRRPALGADLWWTVLYLANWHAIDSSGYFAAQELPSPLLHMWSLAVEEQFYLVWPLVVALVWAVCERRGERAGRWGLAACGAALALASVVAFVALAAGGATDRAYMGSDAKAFEPLLGAVIAVVVASPRAAALVRRHATVLGWASAVAAAVVLPLLGTGAGPTRVYFTWGAPLLSAAVGLLVAAVALGWVRGLSRLLALAPVSYLGRISYGIYLWHWPLVCWILRSPTWSWRRAAAVVVGSVVLAALSYVLVEMPVRHGAPSRWLTARRTMAWNGAFVAVLAIGAAVLGGTPISPAVQRVVALPGPDRSHTLLVIGDSVPQRLLPELSAAADARGLTLLSATAGGCSPLGARTVIAPGDVDGARCAATIPGSIRDALRTTSPGTVVWWSRYELADRYDGATLLRAGTPEFWAAQRRDLDAALRRITDIGAVPVVVLVDRPGVGMATRCTPTACHPFLRRLVSHDDIRQRWNDILRQAVPAAGGRVVGIDDVFCHDARTPCDDRNAAGRPVRADGSHFSEPDMRAAVSGALLDRVLAARRP